MRSYNPGNERIKAEYFGWLKEGKGRAAATIDGARSAIARYEAYTGLKDFATFNKDQAIGFKRHLARVSGKRSGGPLAKSTLLSISSALKDFFGWLGGQPGYRSRWASADIAYLGLSEADTRAAKEPRFKSFPSLEQVRSTIEKMPAETEVDQRNRALLAFAIITGMRDRAMISLRLKHIDLERRLVVQDPREVRTKGSKRIDTFFFPVSDDLERIVVNWILFLRSEKLFGENDPVFPRAAVRLGPDHAFVVCGIEREFWTSAAPVRKVFRDAFAGAGIRYFNPHSFRDTLVQLGERLCPTIEHFKAWSQNIGHEHVQTTLTSYGALSPHRQGELVRSVAVRPAQPDDGFLDLLERFHAAARQRYGRSQNILG
jgi:integrase